MRLNTQDVHKVAHLARLHLTPNEEEQFASQLSQILDYIELLNELDVETVQPTSRAINLTNIMRDDRLEPWLDYPALLHNSPDHNLAFFKVPKILR